MIGGDKMSVQNEEYSEAVEIIRRALQSMEFGSITIMVQDGHIVSIDSTEKFKVKLGNNKTDRNAGGFKR
ncbi:MAG: YezD family protein [Oscillospiraceae bacterium]|nr:YezD family protein [Oscillospiraceae bacterium]